MQDRIQQKLEAELRKLNQGAGNAGQLSGIDGAQRLGRLGESKQTIDGPTFSMALDDLDVVISRATTCADRLEQLQITLFGPIAVPANSVPVEKPNSVILALNSRRTTLEEVVDRLERITTAIERRL